MFCVQGAVHPITTSWSGSLAASKGWAQRESGVSRAVLFLGWKVLCCAALCIVGCLAASWIKLDPSRPSPPPGVTIKNFPGIAQGPTGPKHPCGAPMFKEEGFRARDPLGRPPSSWLTRLFSFRKGFGSSDSHWSLLTGAKELMDSVSLGCSFLLGGDLVKGPQDSAVVSCARPSGDHRKISLAVSLGAQMPLWSFGYQELDDHHL